MNKLIVSKEGLNYIQLTEEEIAELEKQKLEEEEQKRQEEEKKQEEEANRPPTLEEEVSILKEENISMLEDVVNNSYRLTLLELGL